MVHGEVESSVRGADSFDGYVWLTTLLLPPLRILFKSTSVAVAAFMLKGSKGNAPEVLSSPVLQEPRPLERVFRRV